MTSRCLFPRVRLGRGEGEPPDDVARRARPPGRLAERCPPGVSRPPPACAAIPRAKPAPTSGRAQSRVSACAQKDRETPFLNQWSLQTHPTFTHLA
ncbi:unnamed protein product [Rangifer tarandus platyrhynchus]|uniref:Uncharacterized protein n=2 Tax=Rangifer tarandus platyrhynchus TaxID=3082113 RepID=A0ABN8YQ50_RANTA|nr:unnamed protein product [Rangifer tarandus platyrhynchus]CAI9701553.1 unnamed protein product [Rangifer tarandus platyrhynchus]